MDDQNRLCELLERAAMGDAVALTLLLTKSRSNVCHTVSRRIPARLRGAIDADDMVQMAHVEVFRHIASFEDRGEGSFVRWVTTIALRKLRDAIKARDAEKRGGGRIAVRTREQSDSVAALLDLIAVTDRTPSRSAARHERAAALRGALALLRDDHRQAVELVYLQGATVAEAAERMGRTERAIHNLCHKAKGHLRDLLGSGSRFLSDSS